MKKTIYLSFPTIGICLITMLSACQPVLKEFQPGKGSPFHLSFSYPSNWNWEASPNARKTYDGMFVFEPYSVNDEKSGMMISIEVWKDARPEATMQEQMDVHLKGIESLDRLELLDDQTLEIDGHFARWLTIVNTWESTDPGTTYIDEFIYLLSEDRYYTITLYIPESEVGGRFHTEFKTMVESIKILP